MPPVFDSQTAYLIQTGQSTGTFGTLQAIPLGSNTVKWTSTDSAVCSVMVVGPIKGWDSTIYLPMQVMAAGDGVLVVPDGTRLAAYTLSMSP